MMSLQKAKVKIIFLSFLAGVLYACDGTLNIVSFSLAEKMLINIKMGTEIKI